MFVCSYFEYGVLKIITNETLEIIQKGYHSYLRKIRVNIYFSLIIEINTYSHPYNGIHKMLSYLS